MPLPTAIQVPDANRVPRKYGMLKDSDDNFFPLVRFQDETISVNQSVTGATFGNGQIVGTVFTFPSIAASNGWGGVIGGACLNINNTTLSADTLTLLLFNQPVTVTSGSNLSALTLTDVQSDAYTGSITFSNAFSLSSRNLFSANALSLRYVCASTDSALYGFLVLNAAASRALATSRISIQFDITKS